MKIFILMMIVVIVSLFVMENILGDPVFITRDSTIVSDFTDDSQNDTVNVKISGSVKHPGSYTLLVNATLYELIEAASGLTDDADSKCFMSELILTDKNEYYIAHLTEETKTSINNATETELVNLPGIGVTFANRIIDFRETNGRFKQLEDIMKVSGIGESTFTQLKDLICL